MSALASKYREAYQGAEAEAKRLWTEFDELRKGLVEAGVDPTKDKDKFDVAHEKHREYQEKATEATALREQYVKAAEMDGGPVRHDPLEIKRELPETRRTPGDAVVESDEYKQLLGSGVLDMERAPVRLSPIKAMTREELKTLLTGGGAPGSTLNRNERLPGVLPLMQAPLQIANLVTVGATDSNVIEWVRQSGVTNNAAETAEATATTGTSGTKPESALAFVLESTTVRTIAHWIPATKQALQDVAQLRTLVDSMLIDGVRRRLNGQLLSGDGVAPNLRGILNTPGISTVTRGAVGEGVVAGEPAVEAILRAITLVRLSFHEPTAILMHPNDYLAIRLMRDDSGAGAGTGSYIFGPPSMAGTPVLWGLPIVQDTTVPQNTAIVGEWDEAILYVREGVNVTATDSHSDFFVRNMIAILAEGRYGVAVPRPAAFCTVSAV